MMSLLAACCIVCQLAFSTSQSSLGVTETIDSNYSEPQKTYSTITIEEEKTEDSTVGGEDNYHSHTLESAVDIDAMDAIEAARDAAIEAARDAAQEEAYAASLQGA
jgi:hypothetical protein